MKLKKKLVALPPLTKDKPTNKALEKARAARKNLKIRSYNDSPAGHCEDRLRRIAKFIQKVYVRTNGWSIRDDNKEAEELKTVISGIDTSLTIAGTEITNAIDGLKVLASKAFKPKLRARGSKKLEVAPGMRVWLKPEAYLNILREEAYTRDQLDKLVLSKYATNIEKMMLVRVEKNEPNFPSLGYIHRKHLTSVRPNYAEFIEEDDIETAPKETPTTSTNGLVIKESKEVDVKPGLVVK